LGGVSQARISGPPREIAFTTATQTLDKIDRWTRLNLFLLELRLNPRPVARSGLQRRPHLLLIRRQPQTRAKGSQTRVQKGGTILIGNTRALARRSLTTIRPPLLRLSLRWQEAKADDHHSRPDSGPEMFGQRSLPSVKSTEG